MFASIRFKSLSAMTCVSPAAVLASTLLCVLVLVAPAQAAFPGKNGRIAFISNRDGPADAPTEPARPRKEMRDEP
jgi:hypothetical protein